MRALGRLRLPAFLVALGLAASAHGCSGDPDTPTPSLPSYPHDAVDDLALNQRVVLDGLAAPVRVVRDKGGMVHVFARSLADASRVQGYLMARDRAPQLELFRRIAEGRLAEWAGNAQPSLRSQDLTMRALGLRRTADAIYANLAGSADPEAKDAKLAIDAFAAGVTAYFRKIRGGEKVPAAWGTLPKDRYTDWAPQSTLAIARLQTYLLSYTAGEELAFTQLYDAYHRTFDAPANAALTARAKMALDVMRFAPTVKVPVVTGGAPAASTAAKSIPASVVARKPLPPALADQARRFFEASHASLPGMHANSNNWVVSGAKSADGHALVASDPHLPLPSPAIWYMNSLHVLSDDPAQQFDAAGVSFAGIPSVVLGANRHVAWGATVAFFDVNDIYQDEITDGQVTIAGTPTKVETITEAIDYGDGRPVQVTFETIPGHGLVLPKIVNDRWVPRDPATEKTVLAYRWTGMEPTAEILGFLGVQRAKNAHEAKGAMERWFEVGAQNFVFGDADGHIAYTTHAHVPTRPEGARKWDPKRFAGQLPCMVIPGDAGLEWSGRVENAQLPQAEDPAAGYVATANSDQYGLSFDNDPANDAVYLGCEWDEGYREGRIHERLDAKAKVDLDEVQAIQADVKSPLGAGLAKHFVKAIERAEAARASGTIPADLAAVLADPRYAPAKVKFAHDALVAWAAADYEAASGVVVDGDPLPTPTQEVASQATAIFNAAMVALGALVLDDEAKAMGSPPWSQPMRLKGLYRLLEKPAEGLATADASGESVLWDDLSTDATVESKDDRLLRALLAALAELEKELGPEPSAWRWGALHAARFDSMLPGSEATLSIPSTNDARFPNGFPRHGDYGNVDRGDPEGALASFDFRVDPGAGPSQRFAASLSGAGVVVRNAIPGGNVWDAQSPHFDDLAQLWRLNRTRAIPQTMAEVVADAEERIDFLPF